MSLKEDLYQDYRPGAVTRFKRDPKTQEFLRDENGDFIPDTEEAPPPIRDFAEVAQKRGRALSAAKKKEHEASALDASDEHGDVDEDASSDLTVDEDDGVDPEDGLSSEDKKALKDLEDSDGELPIRFDDLEL